MHKGRARSAGKTRRWPWIAGALVALAGLAGCVTLYLLHQSGYAPRTVGAYLAQGGQRHNPVIAAATRQAEATLLWLDRGELPYQAASLPPLNVGVQPAAASAAAASNVVLVDSTEQALRAIAAAQPGQAITFLPGRYRFDRSVTIAHAGTAAMPIKVRADQPGTVQLDFFGEQGFHVMAPYWQFENLAIQGSCQAQKDCEHAFHVTGPAHHFVARNLAIKDFNAHFKVNGEDGQFPDHGVIENCTLTNTVPRNTDKPVTPVDVVTVSGWTLRRNYIADFIKTDGDRVSYGAFFKGAGSRNVMEQNMVVCEDKLRGLPGQRVGLSLGGGGTLKSLCRDKACVTEQSESTLRSNLVANCSDDGIYLNSAARSTLLHNTLLDTGGMTVRFAASSADVEGNLVDGAIRGRDGGVLRLNDNQATALARLYLGSHPLRAHFRAPLNLDFGWREPAGRRTPSTPPGLDLCGAQRPATPRYGAFEDFSACLAPTRQ